jgi:hypothetical protein
MRTMPTLRELLERRAYDCRLTPDRALESLDEAAEFVQERGLVTLTPDCALPSLFEACQEEAYDPAKTGFAQWPKTKYWWPIALEERDDVVATKLHRGKTLLLSLDAARLADPICRAELERMEAAEEGWARLLRHLADAGPSELEDLQTELALAARELKSLRHRLERCGAVVARSTVYEEPHRHTSLLARWDQAHPRRSGASDVRQALGDLVCAGVRAAVVAPEREPARWFSWRWYWDDGIVDELVAAGRLVRVDGHLAAGG